MSYRKILVPEGMLTAACTANHVGGIGGSGPLVNVLEAALLWLSENPIVPSDEQINSLFEAHKYGVSRDAWKFYFSEWQRRMFLAPEPEVPAEIKGLIDGMDSMAKYEREWATKVALEAFRLGKKSGGK